MTQTWNIACVQMEPRLRQKDANLRRILERAREAAGQGARLVIFPECAVPGYCFDDLQDALRHAEPIPGPSTGVLEDLCKSAGVYIITGILERTGDGRLFNAAALVGPRGVVGSYRKIHLPFLGVDRIATPGDRPFKVWEIDLGTPETALRVGLHICYDGSFPESVRVMALQGADLVALPTNWPTGSEYNADYAPNTRALENTIYYAVANRIGTEEGFRFIGRSKICDPSGRTLAEAGADTEQILYAEIDPAVARNKLLVRVPGKHHINRIADRRPEMYGPITAPKS